MNFRNIAQRIFALNDIFKLECLHMLLDQDTLKFVFGMKLRGLRLDKGLSLKDLAKKTGLSPSYLNEIEKGKKYPKTEKILILAQALEEKYEDLISLELKRDLQLVQNLLDKKFLTGIPFDLFGIPASMVFELLAERPKKMRALVGTILEIARAHNIQIDDFLFALLRAYIDMHDNSFPSLEESAKKSAREHGLRWNSTPQELKDSLIQKLAAKKIQVLEQDLLELSPDFRDVLYFTAERGRKFYLSNRLELSDQVFILAREFGFHELRLKTRPQSSLILNLDSFDQLFNHFSASYFASSLLIPEEEIVQDLKNLFSQKEWREKDLEKLLRKYACSYESLFHRMTQIIPKHFGLKRLFFLRYEYDLNTKKYEIARELHLSNPQGPHRIKGFEHYCSRWLIYRLTQQQMKKSLEETSLGIQRSRYSGTASEYVVFSVSFQKPQFPHRITSVCIGILNNEALAKSVPWSSSETIASYVVGETCERCAEKNCSERAAPVDPLLDPERFERIFKTLHSFAHSTGT